MENMSNRTIDFTEIAWDNMYNAVDHAYFFEKDTELIYKNLEEKLLPVSFGAYLQRYIYLKCGMTGHFREMPIKDYQAIIMDSFRDTGTPASFVPTTAKLSALCKNWLSQQTVKRQVVLLLGFGLKMSIQDVNEFLYKALHEPMLNIRDPQEVICMYCYEKGLGFYKYQQLWHIYEQTEPQILDEDILVRINSQNDKLCFQFVDEVQLINYLSMLKSGTGSKFAETAFSCFHELYDRSRMLIADLFNRTAEKENSIQANAKRSCFMPKDISKSDVEHILYSAVPVDKNGNLSPMKRSTLNVQFEGKRLSRKHLNDILLHQVNVERFDLITLNFLIFSLQADIENKEENPRKRYIDFIKSTNDILAACSMGPIYVTNPYECFVLMCILSISPLETYADVWEKSYEE